MPIRTTSQLDALVQTALEMASEGGAGELAYAETMAPADPVSLELRRALRLRRMNGARWPSNSA